MPATRPTTLWSGLLSLMWVVGTGSAAAGRSVEGAPLASPLLPEPVVIVEAGRGVDLAAQILWSDPERIHLLGILPPVLLGIEPRTGVLEVLATEGPGPFEIQGPLVLLSAGEQADQILVHLPARLLTLGFTRTGPPFRVRQQWPVTGCVVEGTTAWWLGPALQALDRHIEARVELRRGPRAHTRLASITPMESPVWNARHQGEAAEVVAAQYFTRLLRGPDRRLWRVVLGMRGRADLIDPSSGDSEELQVPEAEGAWIEASADSQGCLYLLVSGGTGSLGRRILRFGPEPDPALIGDRDWSTGAVDPSGQNWAAVDAESGAVLVYELPSGGGSGNR